MWRGRNLPIHGMHTLYFQKEYYLTYHSPTFRTIALGSVLFLLLIAILLRSAEVIKLIGSPLLFLPEKLHLIECLHAYDVARVDSDGRLEVILNSSSSGRFAIYTGNTTLLLNTNARLAEEKPPTIHVTEANGGNEIPVYYFERSLRFFDTRFARGRPIYGFQIERPGTYVISSPSIEATIYIVPDYTTDKEGMLTAAYLIQAGILLTPAGFIFVRQYRKQRARNQQLIGLKQINGESFWKSQFKNKR
jgi:hypothetical protein